MSAAFSILSARPEQLALVRLAQPGDSTPDQIAAVVSDVQKWDLLLSLAKRHRLGPLLFHRLDSIDWSGVPAEVQASLRAIYRGSAGWNLMLSSHLVELVDELAKLGIRAIAYKGLAVAEAYYHSQLLRPIGDVDLVVSPEGFESACQAAHRIGYREIDACGYSRSLVRGHVEIEIHRQFSHANFPLDLSFDALWNRAELVRIADREVTTFAPEDALILLSAHGVRHLWKRLIWLVDVAQLLAARPQMHWGIVSERADSIGCRRVVALSLLLCHRLFSTNIPPSAAGLLWQEKRVRRLADMIQQQQFPSDAESKTGRSHHFIRFLVRERLRDQLRMVTAALVPHESEWQIYSLRSRFQWLAYLMRPPRLIAQYAWWVMSRRAKSLTVEIKNRITF